MSENFWVYIYKTLNLRIPVYGYAVNSHSRVYCILKIFFLKFLDVKKVIRKASVKDASQIKHLVNQCAEDGAVLPLGIVDIYDSIRDFTVYEKGSKILGVSSLKIVWEDLGEIRSLAVESAHRRNKIGSQLVKSEIAEAGELGIEKVFILTTSQLFFMNMGFKEIDKGSLPHKIWRDCVKCIKFPNCDEVAMLRNV